MIQKFDTEYFFNSKKILNEPRGRLEIDHEIKNSTRFLYRKNVADLIGRAR